MYFPDLTPYRYFWGFRQPARNCGWLDARHDFAVGPVTDDFLAALRVLTAMPVVRALGFHVCNLCATDARPGFTDERGVRQLLGSAEIRAFHPRGALFAAPNLLLHYVEAHGYRPPDVFIEAALHSARDPAAHAVRLRDYEADRQPADEASLIAWDEELEADQRRYAAAASEAASSEASGIRADSREPER